MAHPASDHTTIILDDITYEDMKSLLDFVYTGGVTIPEDRLQSFLTAAETLNITVLTNKNLHQQQPANEDSRSPTDHLPKRNHRPEAKTMPPLIKVDHDKNPFFRHSFKEAMNAVNPQHNYNGFKFDNRLKNAKYVEFSSVPTATDNNESGREKSVQTPNNNNNSNSGEIRDHLVSSPECSRKAFKSQHETVAQEKPETFMKYCNRVQCDNVAEERVKSHLHDAFKRYPLDMNHLANPLSPFKFDTSSIHTNSPSPETVPFQWMRPIPSLMPIAVTPPILSRRDTVTGARPLRRSLGGILTPSPWAQNGRPPVGAPRVVRPDRKQYCAQKPPAEEQMHVAEEVEAAEKQPVSYTLYNIIVSIISFIRNTTRR